MIKLPRLRSKQSGKSAEKISSRILYALIATIAIIFALFYFVGFDAPAMWDERYNSPLLTDILIIFGIILLIATIAVALGAKIYSLSKNKTAAIENGIHGKRITWSVVCCVTLFMALTFFIVPATPISVNGDTFAESQWLRVSNMFVITCPVLIIACLATIIYGTIRNRRKNAV